MGCCISASKQKAKPFPSENISTEMAPVLITKIEIPTQAEIMDFFRMLDEHVQDQENKPRPKKHPDPNHEYNKNPDAFIEKYIESKLKNQGGGANIEHY